MSIHPRSAARTAQRRPLCLLLAVLTIALGLVWRLFPLGMPAALVKYGGSALWAAMVYWLAAFLLAQSGAMRIAVRAACVAVTVECLKRLHAPALDAFRLTLAGKLLLGRIFAWADILVYLLAIACTAALDRLSAGAPLPEPPMRSTHLP